jgi:leucine dehydrogenase
VIQVELKADQSLWEHDRIYFASDRDSGLRAIIALHYIRPGRTGGGIRFFPYASVADALHDVLRLSRAMTYKFAMAGLPIGGGKAVIIGDPKTDKTDSLLEAFGRAVDELNGLYTCAEDVGTTPADMAVINRQTEFVAGLPGGTGDTSPATGLGVFHALRAAVERRLPGRNFNELRIAVQGVGNVGRYLCKHLHEKGAKLFVADIDEQAVQAAAKDFDAQPVPLDEILSFDADVLAPCALGAVLNDETVPRVRAAIVCGGANNQLAEPRHGQQLADRGILYVPDYVANAGGVLSGAQVLLGLGDAELAARLQGIYATCNKVFDYAQSAGIPTSDAADRMAEDVISR